ISTTAAGTGWGGRMADRVAAYNSANAFPVITSLDGAVLFTTGASSAPLTIPINGRSRSQATAAGPPPTRGWRRCSSSSRSPPSTPSSTARTRSAPMRSTIVNPILTGTSSTIAPLFANLKTSTAKQLFQVAKMIEARDQTGAGRQIFFVQLGSFDTHCDQLNRQTNQL